MRIVILVLMVFFKLLIVAQPTYNACNSALELCPGKVFSVTNIAANKSFCPGCEDDFAFCFTSNNSIWLSFTTNSIGGNVQVDLTNLVFETNPGQGLALQASILSATVPCNSASYTTVGNCVSNGTGPFTLSALGLPANTTFYVVISGDKSGAGISIAAECTFDVVVSGVGIDRPAASISIAPNATFLCKNDVFIATATITNCPDNSSYLWYVNGELVAETVDSVFQTSSLNQGDIVSVETACYALCADTVNASTGTINVYSFALDAGLDQTINAGESAQLMGTTSATIYAWSPSFGVSDTSSLYPFVYPLETTTYMLSATENDCSLQDFVTISINEELLFPTTFSPNDDGINDTWEITGINQFPNSFVRIYDRWGQEIFQSTGYSKTKAWDGTIKSNKLAEGVYFYIIQLRDDAKREFKGSITLIR
jgi:gliding motility-associated-like protein